MRWLWLGTALALAPIASGHASAGVVEVPVSFQVVNQNTSVTAPACDTDGNTYTVRGSLVGPAGVEAGAVDSITLYLHGSGDGSSWHLTAVPGYDHITEMAKLGHASVFIHALGYGSSDAVDGNRVCFGSLADGAHQVIQHLRNGTYTAGIAAGPAFERVALAGHSGGGIVAELEAVSFHDSDALIVSGWPDWAPAVIIAEDPAGPFFYAAVAGFGRRCATAPESKQPGGPSGWAHVFTTRNEFEILMPNTEPAILDAFVPGYEQDPCGIGRDAAQAIAANIALAATVHEPVLLPYGDREPFLGGAALAAQQQAARYALGSNDVSIQIVPDSGHGIMLERPAPVFRAGLSHWLRARGF
jgi:pimeloyl-ACP methyl ester carboxylesterase